MLNSPPPVSDNFLNEAHYVLIDFSYSFSPVNTPKVLLLHSALPAPRSPLRPARVSPFPSPPLSAATRPAARPPADSVPALSIRLSARFFFFFFLFYQPAPRAAAKQQNT